jgi:hypothetical protein
MTASASNLCPPTPPQIGDAANEAEASHAAAKRVARALDSAGVESPSYRHLADAYVERLRESAEDEQRLRAVMQQYGRYLHQHGVRPEHIVICARAALELARIPDRPVDHRLTEQAVRSTIEGYYLEAATPRE